MPAWALREVPQLVKLEDRPVYPPTYTGRAPVFQKYEPPVEVVKTEAKAEDEAAADGKGRRDARDGGDGADG